LAVLFLLPSKKERRSFSAEQSPLFSQS